MAEPASTGRWPWPRPHPHPRLRAETPDDRTFLRSLFHASSLAAMGRADEAGLTPLLEAQHRAREQTYAVVWPDARRWVIEAAGAPVGSLIEADAGAAIHVIDIALAPAIQRQGVGRAVIADLQRTAATRDLAVTAKVMVGNAASLALFRGLGFTGEAEDGEAQVQLCWRPLT